MKKPANQISLIRVLLVVFCIIQFNHGSAQSNLVDEFVDEYMLENHIPGCAAILVKEGHVVYEKYFGYANLETAQPVGHNTTFMLASTSKTITVTAIINELERGCFALRDSIDTFSSFVVRNPNYPDNPISFLQLMTHTSSINDNWTYMPYYNGDSPLELQTYLSEYLVPGGSYYSENNYENWPPGMNWAYSNIGVALLGYLVESISSFPFDIYCNDTIFTPLCMNNTSWFLAGLDTTLIARPYTYRNGEYADRGLYCFPDYPDGQLRTTAVSLAKFMQLYIDKGTFNQTRILDSSTVDTILSDMVPGSVINHQGLIFKNYNYGDYFLWGHDGADRGVRTEMYFDIQHKTGAIVLTNGEAVPFPIITRLFDYADEIPTNSGVLLDCEFTTSVSSVPSYRNVLTEILLYPNPNRGLFNVVVSTPGYEIYAEIFNSQGTLISRKSLKQEHNFFDITNQPSGIYYIKIVKQRTIINSQIIIRN